MSVPTTTLCLAACRIEVRKLKRRLYPRHKLRGTNKGIKPNQVADYFRCTRPYVSKLVKSLIRKGLLEKKSDDTDGRSYYLLCSQAGSEIVEEIMEDYLTVTRKLYEGLGAEKSAQLVDLLEESTSILES